MAMYVTEKRMWRAKREHTCDGCEGIIKKGKMYWWIVQQTTKGGVKHGHQVLHFHLGCATEDDLNSQPAYRDPPL